MAKEPLRILVPAEDKLVLEELAAELDLTVSYLVRKLIRDYLEDLRDRLN